MFVPNLRAVGIEEKASPREPMTVTTAARDGTTRDLLVALRTRIATTVESSDMPPRDLAALSKRLTDISKEIEVLDARAEEQGASSGEVEDGEFNPPGCLM